MTEIDHLDSYPGCNCLSRQSLFGHSPGECSLPGRWYVEIHLVDHCESVEGGSTKAVVCGPCLLAFAESARRTIDWGMAVVRSPLCQGCFRPLVRMSNIIEDIAKI